MSSIPAHLEGRSCGRHVREPGFAADAAASCARGQGQGGLLSVSPGHRADERRCQASPRLQVSGFVDRAGKTAAKWRAVRTAKPCGPGRRCYGQALANAAVAPTGAAPVNFAGVREARRNSAPGRARHKPSDHRAGKAVCWASPVCCCAVLPACAFSRSGPRVPPALGLPCALLAREGRATKQSSGGLRRENATARLAPFAPQLRDQFEGRRALDQT